MFNFPIGVLKSEANDLKSDLFGSSEPKTVERSDQDPVKARKEREKRSVMSHDM